MEDIEIELIKSVGRLAVFFKETGNPSFKADMMLAEIALEKFRTLKEALKTTDVNDHLPLEVVENLGL